MTTEKSTINDKTVRNRRQVASFRRRKTMFKYAANLVNSEKCHIMLVAVSTAGTAHTFATPSLQPIVNNPHFPLLIQQSFDQESNQ
ncbi:hypothetical protein RCL1_004358 [Eukaryota sp. TZLM3-RCL]